MNKFIKAMLIFGGALVLGLAVGYVLNLPKKEMPVHLSAYCSGAAVISNEVCPGPPEPQKSGFPLTYTSVAGIDHEPYSDNLYLYRFNFNLLAANILIIIAVFEVIALGLYLVIAKKTPSPAIKK